MNKLLLAVPLLLGAAGSASAQFIPPPGGGGGPQAFYSQPGCAAYGCGGFCFSLFSRIHQHGPLFNYGPYTGYYPFEPYGPWTSDLRYNPPVQNCGHGGCGKDRSWGLYSLLTWKNVCNRCSHSTHKAGTGWSDCSSCGGGAAVGAAAISIPQVPGGTTVAAGDR